MKFSRSCLKDHCNPVQKELEIEHIKSLARPRFVKSTVGMTYVSQLHWSDFVPWSTMQGLEFKVLGLVSSTPILGQVMLSCFEVHVQYKNTMHMYCCIEMVPCGASVAPGASQDSTLCKPPCFKTYLIYCKNADTARKLQVGLQVTMVVCLYIYYIY